MSCARLYDAQAVASAFRLNGKCKLLAVLVDADIDLVDFDLPVSHRLYGRPQMVLKRVRRQAKEDVEQAVIAYFGKERLFVAQGVCGDDLRRRVGNLDRDHARIRNDVREFRQPETIFGATGKFDDPLAAFPGRCDDFVWQGGAEPKGIDRVAQILRQRDAKRFGDLDEFVSRKLELRFARLVVILEDGADDGGVAVRLLLASRSSFLAICFAP